MVMRGRRACNSGWSGTRSCGLAKKEDESAGLPERRWATKKTDSLPVYRQYACSNFNIHSHVGFPISYPVILS